MSFVSYVLLGLSVCLMCCVKVLHGFVIYVFERVYSVLVVVQVAIYSLSCQLMSKPKSFVIVRNLKFLEVFLLHKAK